MKCSEIFRKSLFVLSIVLLSVSAAGCKKNKDSVETVINPAATDYTYEASFSVTSPYSVYGEKPDDLVISFYSSVAPLESIGKEPAGEIKMQPETKGKWFWRDDSTLVFTPSEYWQLDTDYKVKLDKCVFNENVKVKDTATFTTGQFYADLVDSQFYIDPTNPSIKRITGTIKANYPMNRDSLDGKITISYSKKKSNDNKDEKKNYQEQTIKYSLKWNESSTEAYIISDPIPIPPFTSTAAINVQDKITSPYSKKATSKKFRSNDLTIPGNADYVSIVSVDHFLSKNDQQNYDQIFSVSTKGDCSLEDLKNKMEVYVLPNDRPEEQGWPYEADFNWSYNSKDYITPLVISKSQKIDVSLISQEEKYSKSINFKFKGTPDKYIYVKINKDVDFYGGYKLPEERKFVFKVKRFPKEMGILSEGTILSLSGSKKMAMYSRGVQNVQYRVSRIMPKDVNHLVSMSNGNLKNFRFDEYNFNENNIAESQTYSYKIPDYSDEYISYFSFDFTPYLRPEPKKHLSNGLFIFNVYSSSFSDKRLVLVTDLGFFVKKNADGTKDIFVQSISSGRPVSNAEVSIIGLNGNSLVSSTTDYSGHVQLPNTSRDSYTGEHTPVAYVVKTDDDLSFMPYSTKGRTLDYSNFDIGGEYGREAENKITGYIFSDRGMYRPGDTVNLGVIVKPGNWTTDLSNLPMECSVTDPKGTVIYSEAFRLSSSGFNEVSFATQSYSPTGEYNIHLSISRYSDGDYEYLTGTSVKIEEFLPDNLTISTSFEPFPSEGWVTPGELKGVVSLKNLFGTPAVGNDIKAETKLYPGFPTLRKYSDYRFSDPYSKNASYSESLPAAVTDENGEVRFNLDLTKFEKATYRLEFYAEGFEKGAGRSVSQQSSICVSPLEYLIGVRNDGNLGYINKNDTRKISFIAIDQNLERMNVKNLKLVLYEKKYVSTLVKQSNDLYKYQSVERTIECSTESFEIAEDGTDILLDTKTPGEYEIKIVDNNGLVFSRISYSVIGEENTSRKLTRTAELEISMRNEDVRAGGIAQVFIKAPYEGSGLITVERDHVYTWKWFTSKELSSIQTVNIPSGVDGNVYINVMYTRDIDSKEIFMSPFCYGTIPVTINKEARKNKIMIEAPDEVKSGSEMKITYATEKPAKIVVYAVDEGILQVAGYSMPDPLSTFFRKRALEVTTSQILDLILPEYNVLKTLSATGGGAGMDELARNLNPFKRKQNAPVVYWSGIIDADSTPRELSYTIPDYFNGSVRVMAVAVSKESIGVERKSVLARNTFIISPNTPLAVAPGDEFDVSVTVTNNHKSGSENNPVTLKVETDDKLEVVGEKLIKLNIAEGKDSTVSIKVKAKNNLGGAELKFTASDSTESSTLSATMSVRPSMPYQTWVYSGSTSEESKSINVDKKLYDEFAVRSVSVSNLPLAYQDGMISYLANYPYGCSEQVTSKAYPYVFDFIVEQAGKTRKDAEKMIADTISILQSRQRSDGHIGYWTVESAPQNWVTLYVADFVTDAKLHDFYVPPKFVDRVVGVVNEIARGKGTTEQDIYERAYAIFILTKNEIITTSLIEKLEPELNKDNFSKKSYAGLYLAASYAMLKQNDKADELIKNIDKKSVFSSSWYFDNSLRYIATCFDIVSNYFPAKLSEMKTNDIRLMVESLDNANINSYSSQAVLRALEGLVSADRSVMYEVNEMKDGKVLKGIELSEDKYVLKGTFSAEAQEVQYLRKSNFPIFYQTLQAGYECIIPEKKIAEGIEVYREFCDLNGKPVKEVKLGDDVLVKIRFRSKAGIKSNVAIVDLQPAGFEADIESIRNFRSNDFEPDYVDVREDRIVIYTTFFDDEKSFTYKVKAINSGKFVVPPLFAESMYNKSIRAITPQPALEIKPRND